MVVACTKCEQQSLYGSASVQINLPGLNFNNRVVHLGVRGFRISGDRGCGPWQVKDQQKSLTLLPNRQNADSKFNSVAICGQPKLQSSAGS